MQKTMKHSGLTKKEKKRAVMLALGDIALGISVLFLVGLLVLIFI